jgi:hypothetical protein
LIAGEPDDVQEQQGWRVVREAPDRPGSRKSWCESDDPEIATKAADVVGL